jgi:hypothetical protein
MRSHPHIIRHKKRRISSSVRKVGIVKSSVLSLNILQAIIKFIYGDTATKTSEQNKDKN